MHLAIAKEEKKEKKGKGKTERKIDRERNRFLNRQQHFYCIELYLHNFEESFFTRCTSL